MTTPPLSEQRALDLDAADPVPSRRDEFHLLAAEAGDYPEVAYMAGNSLGLQPRSVRTILDEELAEWARLGVEGHLEAERPWAPYHEFLREPAARLVGAQPREVVVMNSLTVNLHLMMVSFYRPTAARYAIVIEDSAFPSDSYAARSQAAFHGYDPDTAVIRLRPRAGEDVLRTEDVVSFLGEEGHRVAMVMLGGVNYLTGELMDIPTITAAAREAGIVVGWDLAHAAGNVELALHEWGVDWAAWCTYKYLNAGPGALAGCFVHERHLADRSLPKLQGWWSTRYETRFQMHPVVEPVDSADSWQLSNPPILAMAPVLASLRMFDESGMATLRAKSRRLTGYLAEVLGAQIGELPLQIITPSDPDRRGTQLSVRIGGGLAANDVARWLRHEHGVIADARQPDVIRLAPVPMYCTFHDAWRAAQALVEVVRNHG
ncbi:kynureninase [Nocardioides sp. SLBN-35]|uniref:kynureninase n=1 Tax=Nocardioides sp. SLBN-35 TaxID=2768445 RepID=UPI00114DC7A0|nr:kynureninase [Nocardioides sp. SLBN-35]TQK68922.1 kynureninase [Nocardioides sp. SLBN-35]